MKKIAVCITLLCLLLAACGQQEELTLAGSTEATTPTEATEATTPTEDVQTPTADPITNDLYDFLDHWGHGDHCDAVISGDTMALAGETELTIRGTVAGSGDKNLSQRVDHAEQTYGVLPVMYALKLTFTEETPLSIQWSLHDGLSYPEGKERKGTISDPSQTELLKLPSSMWQFLTSNLEENIYDQYLQILCQYPDRTVEYLLVMETLSPITFI